MAAVAAAVAVVCGAFGRTRTVAKARWRPIERREAISPTKVRMAPPPSRGRQRYSCISCMRQAQQAAGSAAAIAASGASYIF